MCPHCYELQIYKESDSDVFFLEGNHDVKCHWCDEVFEVYTEAVYLYTVKELEG